MPIRLTDHHCLRPRRSGGTTRPGHTGTGSRRVHGVLHRAAQPAEALLVDAIDYDGERCRYRIAATTPGSGEWLTEQPGDEYRSCARHIVDRLRTLGRGEPARLSVVDSLISPAGHVWLALRDDERRRSRWLELPEAL